MKWTHINIEYPPINKPILVTDGKSHDIRIFRINNGIKYWESFCKGRNYIIYNYWMNLPKLIKD